MAWCGQRDPGAGRRQRPGRGCWPRRRHRWHLFIAAGFHRGCWSPAARLLLLDPSGGVTERPGAAGESFRRPRSPRTAGRSRRCSSSRSALVVLSRLYYMYLARRLANLALTSTLVRRAPASGVLRHQSDSQSICGVSPRRLESQHLRCSQQGSLTHVIRRTTQAQGLPEPLRLSVTTTPRGDAPAQSDGRELQLCISIRNFSGRCPQLRRSYADRLRPRPGLRRLRTHRGGFAFC